MSLAFPVQLDSIGGKQTQQNQHDALSGTALCPSPRIRIESTEEAIMVRKFIGFFIVLGLAAQIAAAESGPSAGAPSPAAANPAAARGVSVSAPISAAEVRAV